MQLELCRATLTGFSLNDSNEHYTERFRWWWGETRWTGLLWRFWCWHFCPHLSLYFRLVGLSCRWHTWSCRWSFYHTSFCGLIWLDVVLQSLWSKSMITTTFIAMVCSRNNRPHNIVTDQSEWSIQQGHKLMLKICLNSLDDDHAIISPAAVPYMNSWQLTELMESALKGLMMTQTWE